MNVKYSKKLQDMTRLERWLGQFPNEVGKGLACDERGMEGVIMSIEDAIHDGSMVIP